MKDRQEKFREKLRELGFDEVRFAEAGAVPEEHRERYLRWVDAGFRADMAWIDRSLEKRFDPERVLAGVGSVILLGVNYLPPEKEAREQKRWAKYALYSDYHDTVKAGLVAAGKILEEDFGLGSEDYRYYTDTGPVLERGWSARSGLGWQGKNGMLISREHGNWLMLAAILVRYSFAPDEPVRAGRKGAGGEFPKVGELCGSCTRCLEACPTGAIVEPGIVDANRCISYQTIENKGIIPRELRAGIGGRIFGCDICLDVCPWNRFAKAGRQQLMSARFDVAALSLEEILAMEQADFSRIFAKTPIKRLKWRGLLRNACVVAGNLRDDPAAREEEIARLRPLLVRLASHPEAMVRAHAVWAVFRLWPGEAADLLRAARAEETDAKVMEEF